MITDTTEKGLEAHIAKLNHQKRRKNNFIYKQSK